MGGSSEKSLDHFLTPEAMLTPGMAGALTMMITNALSTNFDTPRAYTGLALSFIFGLLVLIAENRWWIKAIYYVLNSLVIFCVAVGANAVGTSKTNVSLAISGPAYAQSQTGIKAPSNPETIENLERTYDELIAKLTSLVDTSYQLREGIQKQREESVRRVEIATVHGDRTLIETATRLKEIADEQLATINQTIKTAELNIFELKRAKAELSVEGELKTTAEALRRQLEILVRINKELTSVVQISESIRTERKKFFEPWFR